VTLLKRIAAAAFVVAFAMAVVIFTGYGRNLIDIRTAQIVFIVSGAVALAFNLFSFQGGKHTPLFNLIYWTGSIVTFVGLVGMQFKVQYSKYIMIGGMVILGLSLVLPAKWITKMTSSERPNDVLDDL
jgi:hypothetical protein